MRESRIEDHLISRVRAAGGETRKVQWIGRRGAPDQLVMLPDRPPTLVELKQLGLTADPHQAREHVRLRRFGIPVIVLDSKAAIDTWLATGARPWWGRLLRRIIGKN